MKGKILEFFKFGKKKEESGQFNLDLNIYVKKPGREDGKYNSPMIILTRKKAKKLKNKISGALSGNKDYVRINITGELNPDKENAKDYSFIALEEMKAPDEK